MSSERSKIICVSEILRSDAPVEKQISEFQTLCYNCRRFGMEISVWAHSIGFFGEALNLAGAIVLARDIFNRKREHERSLSLGKMSADARKREVQSLYYHDIPVNAPDFAEQVAQLYATKLAYWGLGLLIAGFACLAIYHALEIVDARAQPQAVQHYYLDKKF